MSYIIIILSLILDGILSLFSNNNIIFNSLFTLTSLIIIFKYYKSKDNLKYLIIVGMVGLLFDIIYTDTLLFNAGVYLIIGVIITKYFEIFKHNLLNALFLLVITIILYRTFTFLVLANAQIIKLNFYELFKSIYSSLLLNIVYLSCFFIKIRRIKNIYTHKIL